jgi:hypothetical protein
MSLYNLASDKIGIKKLTDADLGSLTSNQTHIGLYEGTLSHLPYERKSYISQLIFDGSSHEGLLFLKFINNNRSPAINMGSIAEQQELPHNVISIGKQIRDFADTNRNVNWYLLWFALDNEEIVTVLINQNSDELVQLQNLGIDLNNITNLGLKIGAGNQHYNALANFLNELTTTVNIEYAEELEIASQTGEEKVTSRIIPRVRDIEKANRLFKDTGLKGEELLYKYFELQKSQSIIKDFRWMNQSKETGMPYDFEITDLDNTIIFSDAKSTSYKFELPIILSSGELHFINENKDRYLIHRLYSINEEPKLRVCDNIHNVSDTFIPNYEILNQSLNQQKLTIRGMKLAVPTDLQTLNFNAEISLYQVL